MEKKGQGVEVAQAEKKELSRQIVEHLLNMPEIQKGKDLWQNAFHELDVFEHTREVVRHINTLDPENLDLVAAACLHDIGKPPTAEPILKDGKPLLHPMGNKQSHHFPEHEKVGAKMVRELSEEAFSAFNLSKDKIAKIVELHFFPMQCIKKMKGILYENQDIDLNTFSGIISSLNDELEATGLKKEVLTIFLADSLAKGKDGTGSPDIQFLKQLRLFLLGEDKGIEALHELFIRVYKPLDGLR